MNFIGCGVNDVPTEHTSYHRCCWRTRDDFLHLCPLDAQTGVFDDQVGRRVFMVYLIAVSRRHLECGNDCTVRGVKKGFHFLLAAAFKGINSDQWRNRFPIDPQVDRDTRLTSRDG